jgi:acetyl-CoA acetyltransferase
LFGWFGGAGLDKTAVTFGQIGFRPSKVNKRGADVDVFFPYDGFTVYGLLWIEAAGYCGRGEACEFIRDCWNEERDRIEVGGRILFNPHGGSLSEGTRSRDC